MADPDEVFEAARLGDMSRLDALLEREPGWVNARDGNGFPLLYWAALAGFNGRSTRNEAVVDLLLARGAELDLFAAAYLSRPRRAAELLASDPSQVFARDAGGMTPLHYAAERGATAVARLLIEQGAEVNARDQYGQTPLHYACHAGPWKAKPAEGTIQLLRERGAEVDLFLAAALGDTKSMEMLLDRDPAQVNATDDSGSTALFHAVRSLHPAAVSLLLSRGADVNARRDDGQTAVSTAIARMNERGGAEVVQLLIQAGAELDLFDACAVGQVDRVRELLQSDRSLARIKKRGKTPLQVASERGFTEIMHLLAAVESGLEDERGV